MGLFLAGCSVFGIRSGTPEPPYKLVGQAGPVEIRSYAPRLAASVTVPGDEIDARATGFRRLAGFIFGGNTTNAKIEMTAPVAQASAKIAMTAPVAQTKAATGWTITFYMPDNYTMATLPVPKDPGIEIHEVPGETVAVLRYSGIPGKAAVAAAHSRLAAALRGAAWHATGAPVDYFYDPPWTLPWARRNEVAVPVAP
jgi:hypothetical protein